MGLNSEGSLFEDEGEGHLHLSSDPEPGFFSRLFDSVVPMTWSSPQESVFEIDTKDKLEAIGSEMPPLLSSSLDHRDLLDNNNQTSQSALDALICHSAHFGPTKDGSLNLSLNFTLNPAQNEPAAVSPASTISSSSSSSSSASLHPFYEDQRNLLSHLDSTTSSSPNPLQFYPGNSAGGAGSDDEGFKTPTSYVLTAVKRLFQTETNRTVSGHEAGLLGIDHPNGSGLIPTNSSSDGLEFPSSVEGASSSTGGGTVFCNRSWDGLICWPEIPEGHSVTVPCFATFNRIAYDTSRTVTRACEEGGFWEEKTNYSNCVPLHSPPAENDDWILEITTWVYFFGYCLSLTALLLAISIFIGFKELRCLRNTIHTHLMVTYIAADALWLITSIQSHITSHSQASCITFILLHYFHLTNFFWMFVEGLYLYVLVVQTFTADNIKLRTYTFIGWGVPLLVVIGWSIAKWITRTAASATSADTQTLDPDFGTPTCFWLTVTVNLYDWIYKSPAILVLAANMIFLLQIMWVLITKLRSATNPETQQSRKAAKALVVLMPLLGITYVLVLTVSKQPMYEHIRALLISTQGFLVALLYCFLNGEVRQAVRHRWNRCSGSTGFRILCCDCNPRDQMHHHMRDWSLPRSRTESIRLYNSVPPNNLHSACQNSQHSHFPRQRMESTTSEMTTLTNLTNSNSIQQLGSGGLNVSSLGSGLNRSRGSSGKNGNNGRNNSFDQVLLSPTFTSISTNLSALTMSPMGTEETSTADFTDVHFIDEFDGDSAAARGQGERDNGHLYD